jgi:hypothetical protein
MPASQSCRVCGSAALLEILHWKDVPTNASLFFASAEEAREHPTGSFRLVACTSCGTAFNEDADETLVEYSQRSIETQAWSDTYNDYAARLARRWVDAYDLRGKTTLEIGCGARADFLAVFCTLTGGPGIGLDPVVDPDAHDELDLRSVRFDSRTSVRADAVVCRHTLEHIVDVSAFLEDLRGWAQHNPDAVVLVDVPDVARVFEETAFWDLYYEHTTYFTACALRAGHRTGRREPRQARCVPRRKRTRGRPRDGLVRHRACARGPDE